MKKSLVLMIVLALVAGAFAAPAGAKKKRKKLKRIEHVVEVPYSGGNLGVATPAASGGLCLAGQPAFACLSTPTTPEDVYVTVEVADSSGQTAGGFFTQNDNDGDGIQDGFGNFCGSSAEPVQLESPGALLGVSLYAGACADGSPSVVTSGTIKLTFSNLP